jgi:subfamily B ATP-binding cassette protein MsbA
METWRGVRGRHHLVWRIQRHQGGVHSGAFISFLTALLMLYEPIKRLTRMNVTIQQGWLAERVYAVLDTRPEIVDRPMPWTCLPSATISSSATFISV